jgi:hypothetical protein
MKVILFGNYKSQDIKCVKLWNNVRFEVFVAVTMKNAIFWDVAPCDSCKNRRFRGMSALKRETSRNIPEDGIFHLLE